jgi:hypothetical protein
MASGRLMRQANPTEQGETEMTTTEKPTLILRLKTTVRGGWYDDTPQAEMIQQLERALWFAKMNLSMREQYQVREDLEAVRNYREAS